MSSISSASGQVAVAVGFLTRDPSLIWNTEECVEDRIFLLMWLMLMFHFCVSTVSTVERVINKTKPSSMQIFVYLIRPWHVRCLSAPYLATCSQL